MRYRKPGLDMAERALILSSRNRSLPAGPVLPNRAGERRQRIAAWSGSSRIDPLSGAPERSREARRPKSSREAAQE